MAKNVRTLGVEPTASRIVQKLQNALKSKGNHSRSSECIEIAKESYQNLQNALKSLENHSRIFITHRDRQGIITEARECIEIAKESHNS